MQKNRSLYSLDRIESQISILIGFLIIFLPFVTIDSFFFESHFLFISFVAIVLVIFAAFSNIISNNHNGRIIIESRIDILITLFAIYVIVQTIILKNYRYEVLFPIFSIIALGYIIKIYMSKYLLEVIMISLVVGALLQSLYGILQYIGIFKTNNIFFRLTGGFSNPGPFGEYLASIYPLILGIYLFKNKIFVYNTIYMILRKYTSIFLILSIFLLLMSISMSHSRSAWISILISSFLLLYKKNSVIHSLLKKKNLFFCGGLILIISLLGLILYKLDSSIGRIIIWKICINNLLTYKVIYGAGLGLFNPYYMNEQAIFMQNTNNSWLWKYVGNINYCYNEFLQYSFEIGIIGVLIIVLVIYESIKKNTEVDSYFYYVFKCSLIGILICSTFSYSLHILPIVVNFIIYIIVCSSVGQTKQRKKRTIDNKIIGVILLFLASIGGYEIKKYWESLYEWSSAIYSFSNHNYENSIVHYKKCEKVLGNNGRFLNNYGKALNMIGKYENSNSILHKSQKYEVNIYTYTTIGDNYENMFDYKKAEEYYWRAHWLIPANTYPLYLLFKLYHKVGNKTKALELGNQIIRLQTKIQSSATDQMRQEIINILNDY